MPLVKSPPGKLRHLEWLLAVFVLILGAAIYLHGIVQNLPYQLNSDEPFTWIFVNRLLQTGSLYDPKNFIPYPPLRMILGAGEQHFLYLATPPGKLTQPVAYLTARCFSVFYGVLLLAVTYQAGRKLHSSAAGIAAMLYLAVQHDAVELSKLLKTDNLAWLLGMVCILFTVRAVRQGRGRLNIYALLFALAAIAAKYTMAPVLGFPILGMILVAGRKSILYAGIVMLIIIVVSGFFVIAPPDFLVRLLRMLPTGVLFGREHFFQFPTLRGNFRALISQVGGIYALVLMVGLGFSFARFSLHSQEFRKWVLIPVIGVMMVGTLFFLGLLDRPSRAQDLFVIVLGFALLWGVGIAALTRQRAALAVLMAFGLLSPRVVNAWTFGTKLTRPDTRVLTAEWFIDHVPAGTHIGVEADKVEFERGYGGFPSDKILFVDEIASVYQESLESFARRGVEYLVADERQIYEGGFYDFNPPHEDFMANVTTVLSLADPYTNGWEGPRRLIFRIPAIQQHPMHAFVGNEIVFKGYDLPSTTIAPGGTLDLVLYWEALEQTTANNIVFAQLLNEQGELVSQLDGPPGDELHRTYDWWPGYFDWDEWPIVVPDSLPEGVYSLVLGMYDADTLVRLPITDAEGVPLGDHLELTYIVVQR